MSLEKLPNLTQLIVLDINYQEEYSLLLKKKNKFVKYRSSLTP